jgi:hypothetical protein
LVFGNYTVGNSTDAAIFHWRTKTESDLESAAMYSVALSL